MTIWEVDEREQQIAGLDDEGRPDPAYAAALGLLPAPLPRRALAFVIDAAAYLVLQVPSWVFTLPLVLKFYTGRISSYGLLNHPDVVLAAVMLGATTLLTLAYGVVQLVLQGRRGVTLGKAVTGLRSVNVKTLERPGVLRVLLRAVVVQASGLVVVGPLLFLLSPLLDRRRRRGWHDHVGQTWLVDVREGLNPYDAKRMRLARRTVTSDPIAAPATLPSLATPADRGDVQDYRPGARVSAGVLGLARPHGAGPRPVVGLVATPERSLATGASQPPTPGRPVVGGYRPHGADETDGVDQQGDDAGASPAPSSPAAFSAGSPPRPGLPVRPQVPTPWRPPELLGEADLSGAALPAAAAQPATAARPPMPPAPPAPAAAAVPAPASPPAATSGPPSGPPPGPLPGARATAGCTVEMDTGERLVVDAVTVLGRNPVPPAEHPGARRVPVADGTRSLSKTHALLVPVPGGVQVVDQHSTNGTAVVRAGAGRTEELLEPGGSTTARPGDTVRFGDRTAVVTATRP